MKLWFVVLLFIPAALAGTPDDPEIEDPANDSVSSIAVFGAPAADLRAAWFFEDEQGLHAAIKLDAPVCADPSESIEYLVYFDFMKSQVFFGGIISADAGSADICPDNASGTSIRPTGQASAASFVGDTVTVTLTPGIAANIGPELTGLYVTSRAYLVAPAAAAAWNDADRAPDAGDAVFARVGPEDDLPDIAYQNVSAPVLTLSANETSVRNGTLHVNWTAAPALGEMAFDVGVVSGRLNVTLTDANGTRLFECLCDGQRAEVVEVAGAAGNWSLTLTFEGFAGEYRIHITEAVQEDNETATPTPTGTQGPGTGNATSEAGDDPQDKDSPVPAALAVVAIACVLARRRW